MTAITVHGVELHYDDFPAREPGPRALTVVWLHGFLVAADSLHDVIADLPAYRHLAIDWRGHGRSAGVTTDVTLAQMADDVWAILQELGVDRFAVVGHSTGNAIGSRLAARHPDAVVAAVSLAGVPITGMPQDTREANGGIPTFQGDEAALGALLGALAVHEGMEAMVKKSAATGSLVSVEVLTAISQTELYRDEHDELLPGLTQPWLFVVPENDLAIPSPSQEAAARTIPNARILMLRGEGHLLPQERPHEVAGYVAAFLASARG